MDSSGKNVCLYYNICTVVGKSALESPREWVRAGRMDANTNYLHGPLPFSPWALRKYFELLTQTVEEEIRLIRLSLLEGWECVYLRISVIDALYGTYLLYS